MKVAEYVKQGLKNFVEAGEGLSGTCTQGCHRVTVFLKREGDRIVDCKFNATKRCKKLLAITDYMCELVKEGKIPTEEELLSMFSEEKEKDKMKNRAQIALGALKEAFAQST